MGKERFEWSILTVLSIMLVSVFVLSVNMYEDIEQGSSEGIFYVFAQKARDIVYENEAVATFLGTKEESKEGDEAEIAERALEYIERYNSVYADTK